MNYVRTSTRDFAHKSINHPEMIYNDREIYVYVYNKSTYVCREHLVLENTQYIMVNFSFYIYVHTVLSPNAALRHP